MELVVLDGVAGGIVVRSFEPADASLVLEAVLESGEDLSRFETWARPPFTIAEAATYVGWWTEAWVDESAFFFAIVDATGLLGACGVFALGEDRSGSMGYWVRSTRTGRGLATDVARLVAQWSFDVLGLTAIDLQVSDSNPASVRIAQKLDAERIGELPRGLPLDSADDRASIYRLRRRPTSS